MVFNDDWNCFVNVYGLRIGNGNVFLNGDGVWFGNSNWVRSSNGYFDGHFDWVRNRFFNGIGNVFLNSYWVWFGNGDWVRPVDWNCVWDFDGYWDVFLDVNGIRSGNWNGDLFVDGDSLDMTMMFVRTVAQTTMTESVVAISSQSVASVAV